MNKVKRNLLKHYRILYNKRSRIFELHKAWNDEDGGEATIVISVISEEALIASMLELEKGE